MSGLNVWNGIVFIPKKFDKNIFGRRGLRLRRKIQW